MQCPSCKQPLIVVERDGIEVDWCLACKGLWFDDGELELLAEKTGRTLDPEDVGRESAGSHAEALRRCPRCDKKMEKALVGRRDPVLVDRCERHGVWLDAGELGSIVAQLDAAGISDQAIIVEFLGETFRNRPQAPDRT